MSDENVGGLVELPTPSAWAIRDGIGDSLWYFSVAQKAAKSIAGYKDSVEPLFTAEKMHAHARAVLSAHCSCRAQQPQGTDMTIPVTSKNDVPLPAPLDEVHVFMGCRSDDNSRYATPAADYYSTDDVRQYAAARVHAALSAHGQPVVDEAMVMRAWKAYATDDSRRGPDRMRAALTSALTGATP